ncbi:MAG: lasso peptide biosynthesis B2 protein [Chitinophagaceae bacterium]|nr:lasso peptide biosynthesis B2 protein [Chitinophagaceae bacterium]
MLSGRVKWLLLKAIFISAFVKIALSFFSFKIILNWLGKIKVESDTGAHPLSLTIRKEIKTAVMLCDKYVFWKTECYTRALTAKLLLKPYHLPSTVYIGFYKDEAGEYNGHAWLRSYDMILTGNKEIEKYTVQSFFT